MAGFRRPSGAGILLVAVPRTAPGALRARACPGLSSSRPSGTHLRETPTRPTPELTHRAVGAPVISPAFQRGECVPNPGWSPVGTMEPRLTRTHIADRTRHRISATRNESTSPTPKIPRRVRVRIRLADCREIAPKGAPLLCSPTLTAHDAVRMGHPQVGSSARGEKLRQGRGRKEKTP